VSPAILARVKRERRGPREWYGTLRLSDPRGERREERHARAALKRAIKAAKGNDEAVGLQLFGQAMPSPVYELFRRVTNQNMKRRRLGQTLPESRREGIVIVWGLEAGTEIVPTISVRAFPNVLGTIVAVRCGPDLPYRGGFVSGLVSWFDINADRAPAWLPAPPLLQQWQLDGVTSIETVDFGLRYPLPKLDVVAA
jgi:hypothetical protein